MPQTRLYKLASATGFIHPYLTFRERRQMVSARFYGDLPLNRRFGLFQMNRFAPLEPSDRENLPLHERENVISYPLLDKPRDIIKRRRNVLYTPQGFAWRGAVLDEEMSSQIPTTNGHLLRPLRAQERIEKGTLLHAEYGVTFGDWISEQSRSLALVDEVPEPVLLPRVLYDRPYVKREFERLGIAVEIIDKPTLVKEATAIVKPQPDIIWNADDVAAYRRFNGIDPKPPRPGSIIYLSREGAKSEQSRATRSYPTESISEIVEELGGKVVHTGSLGYDDFMALADDAETVIADHGAAMFNLVGWQTRSVIELAAENWWDGCFVFLSAALKIKRHEVLNFKDLDKPALKARVEAHLAGMAGVP